MIQIKFTDGRKPIELEADNMRDAIEDMVKKETDLSAVDLRGADLSWANLSWANLSGSNLSGADLDFSCWPLWCGSMNPKIDKRIFCQLLYHTMRAGLSVDAPDVKKLFEIPEVVDLANQFHRVDECGKIGEE